MAITYMDICKGGGGATLGAIAAGLTPILGLDNNPDIVGVARQNFDHPIIQTDILAYSKMDFGWKIIQKQYGSPDWLHASPPCVNASRANNGNETAEDMELAEAICRAIAILKPKYFSLENVAGYSKFYSFEKIKACLTGNGYEGDFNVLDCSDYGVPQSRKRLFLVAVKDTPSKNYLSRLKKQKPIGWKEAIADLIPTLEPTKLTSSQGQSLVNSPKVLTNLIETDSGFKQVPDLVIQRSGTRQKGGVYANTIRLSDEPIFTIKAMSGNVQQATLIVNGKRLKPDIRCYARWQTFPDSYQWPTDFKLAMKICGNAVPPLMFQQVVEAILND